MLGQKLAKLEERKKAGLTSWWRRKAYFGKTSQGPKWHIFEGWDRLTKEDGSYTLETEWRALCGYTYIMNLAFTTGLPMLRDDVKTNRCMKCEKKREKK